jgi:hypothetical protein
MLKGGLTDARLGGRLHAWSGVLGIKANPAKIHISKRVAGGSLHALYIVVLKLWGRGVREQRWCGRSETKHSWILITLVLLVCVIAHVAAIGLRAKELTMKTLSPNDGKGLHVFVNRLLW